MARSEIWHPQQADFIEYAKLGDDVVMQDVAPLAPPKEGEPVVEKKKVPAIASAQFHSSPQGPWGSLKIKC